MATSSEVLRMLIPSGGYVQIGDEFEGIEFKECEPITKAEFEAGFAQYDAWKEQKDAEKETAKTAVLAKLGLTEQELRAVFS